VSLASLPPLVLASSSPRRRDLLTRAGVPFEIVPPEIAEELRPGEAPDALAERLAREKAVAVAERLGPTPRRRVLGADTVVVLEGEALGKPADPEHAVALLRRLVGRRHDVVTGVAIADTGNGRVLSRAVASGVVLRPAEEAELRSYVATGEPPDKAGAYAAQGLGRRFVTRIEGSESNVIGLPVEETLALLREAGAWEPGT